MNREQLMDRLEELGFLDGDEPLVLVDGHDNAAVGVATSFGTQPAMVYDRDTVIANLMEQEMTEDEAEEFFDFNIIGAHVGGADPLFMTRLEPRVRGSEEPADA